MTHPRLRRRLRWSVLLTALLLSLGGLSVATAGATRWQPPSGTTFQLQLQGTIDVTVDADAFEVDMFDTPRSLVQDLHDRSRHVVCYISAGSYENWRPDAGDFPDRVLGRKIDGWPGERWLDIRRLSALKPIMGARLDRCSRKGFDAVDFDNVNGYENRTGFPLSKSDQLAYLRYLSNAAHSRGLAAGLKNLTQLARNLEPSWDFAVVEQCFLYHECRPFTSFIDDGKPVFEVEYELTRSEFCDRANALGFTSMRKRLSLRAWRRPC